MACLTGCMRIYPDPDLPDVRVEWYAQDTCRAAGDTVVVTLSPNGDGGSEVHQASAPCADAVLNIADVPREELFADVTLYDDTGLARANHLEDLDLRDGLSERLTVYFPGALSSFVRGAFVFDMGATCDSLSVSYVALDFTGDDASLFSLGLPCDEDRVDLEVTLSGALSVTARAYNGLTVVATSPRSQPFVFAPGQVTDIGTVVLSPCGDDCPAL